MSQSFTPQVIATSGNYYTNSQGSLSVTIGEMTAVQTVGNASVNLILTQGFQQADKLNSVPLKLVLFTGEKVNNGNLLKWRVLNEVAIDEYRVERSEDGRTYVDIGGVNAQNNGASENNYTYRDSKGISNVVYYRLSIKEKDAANWYSWVVKLTRAGEDIRMYPVPVKDRLTIEVSSLTSEQKELRLVSAIGSVVRTVNCMLVTGSQKIYIDMNGLAAGSYILYGLGDKPLTLIKE